MTDDDILKVASSCGNDNGTTLKSDLDFLVHFARRLTKNDEALLRQCFEAMKNMRRAMRRRYCYEDQWDEIIAALKERLR